MRAPGSAALYTDALRSTIGAEDEAGSLRVQDSAQRRSSCSDPQVERQCIPAIITNRVDEVVMRLDEIQSAKSGGERQARSLLRGDAGLERRHPLRVFAL